MNDFGSILKVYQAKKRKIDNETDKVPRDDSVFRGQRSSNNLKLPSFYIIGAQKCGTMAAVKNLNKHPDIFVANEVHYFDRNWHTHDLEWYSSQFKTNKPILGEKTPELIYVDDCACRIKEVSPDAKFVLFLRDPIARAFSAWNMNVTKNRESATFEECVQRNLKHLDEPRSYGTGEFHYVQRGFYMDQIERFQKVFPDKNRLHIVIAEQVRSDPLPEYRKIFDFLGVSSIEFSPEDDHVGSYQSAISEKVAEKLKKLFKSHNERLFSYLGYRIDEWDHTDEMNSGHIQAQSSLDAMSSKKTTVIPVGAGPSGDCPIGESGTTASIMNCHLTNDMGDFAMLGRKHGTDKVTHHGYHRFYPRFLEHYRALPPGSAMLEIGVDQEHSLHTWLEYFPNAFVYGVDISLNREGDRFQIFKADQSRHADMRRIVERELRHPLFFIIDDGSHIPEHQVSCFDYLFRSALLPGGCYIVEDVETSYWTRGGLYGYTTRCSTTAPCL